MKYLLILRGFALISMFLCSCTPQKRMQRLLKKHPELVTVVDVDTLIRDTIIEKDTFISKEYKDSFIMATDTVIETHRVIVERINNKFNVIVKPDTIIALDTIFYTKEVKVKGKVVTVYKIPKWMWYLIAFLVGVIFFVFLRR